MAGPRRTGSRSARKERVLHTRVSEQLSEDIRQFAEEVRVPASNLVRNVLEEVFSVVDTVSDDVDGLLGGLREEARGVRTRILGRPARSPRRATHDDDLEAELRRDERADQASGAGEIFPDVLGWQPLVANQAQTCAGCGAALRPGDDAFFGVRSTGLSALVVCARCLPA